MWQIKSNGWFVAAICTCLLQSSGFLAAENAEEAKSGDMIERPARTSSRDIKVPRALVHRIESDYRAFLKKNEVNEKTPIKRNMLNVAVELTQTRPLALHENVRIVTPTGGGVIDLSEFVTPLRGAFDLKFTAKTDKGEVPDGLRVFFVSKGKTRALDGEQYGAGCNRYMEVTSFLQKKSSSGGIRLYTAGHRYLSVVGGTFVMTSFSKEALSVGSLTFTDSRFPEVLCD